MSAIVTLKKGEGRTIKAGGAWIFDNEIDIITGRFKNGEVVTVHDFDGYPMGKGFINQNSKIRVRMMTRKADQEIDSAFLKMRVKNAWEYRKTTVDTSSCRIIFGEADFLPGLVIDKYEDVLVVECLALGMEQIKEEIVTDLKEILSEDGITIRGVYERSDANERTKEGLPKVKGFIGEEFDTNIEIVEFVKEQCSGIIDVESIVPENRIPLPCRWQGKPKVNGSRLLFWVGGVLFIAYVYIALERYHTPSQKPYRM